MKINLADIKKKAVPVLKEAGVTRSAIFGSYARGEQKKSSDIDMLVDVPGGTGLFAFVGLKHKLEDALKRKVDLVTFDALHPRLRDRILQEQRSIL